MSYHCIRFQTMEPQTMEFYCAASLNSTDMYLGEFRKKNLAHILLHFYILDSLSLFIFVDFKLLLFIVYSSGTTGYYSELNSQKST